MDIAQEIVAPLLQWFQGSQRKLPWRQHYTPYEVWISEVMLQQTQVKTMLPYFERWMQELPDPASLAAAEEERVLKLWEGLGYYSRARNLKKAAEIIMSEHGGVFPKEHKAILNLPGIGPYTAGAICSIAYEQDEALVDGNVIRVLARLADYREEVKTPHFWSAARELLPSGQARDFNQGLMELGALICTPRSPKCETCPLQKHCKARAVGSEEGIPKKKVKAKTAIQVAVGIIRKPNTNTFFIQKRAAKGLMAGLWEFPGGKVEGGESAEQALQREILEEVGVSIQNVRPFMRIKHAYTSFLVDLNCFICDYESGGVELTAATDHKWVTPQEMSDFPFPAANVKLIQRLTEGMGEL